jgi:hypothetical protein
VTKRHYFEHAAPLFLAWRKNRSAEKDLNHATDMAKYRNPAGLTAESGPKKLA